MESLSTPTIAPLSVCKSSQQEDISISIKHLKDETFKQTHQSYLHKADKSKTQQTEAQLKGQGGMQEGSLAAKAKEAFVMWRKGTSEEQELSEKTLEEIMIVNLDFSSLLISDPQNEISQHTKKLIQEQCTVARCIINTINSRDELKNCIDCAQNVLTDYDNYRGSKPMKLRVFKLADIKAIPALFDEAIYPITVLHTWLISLFKKDVFVMKHGKKIVGCIVTTPEGHLEQILVHKDYQCQGIARDLLEAAKAKTKERGVNFITAEANFAALPFFEHYELKMSRGQSISEGEG